MSSAPSSASTFVAGRYLLRERIGAGAAGEIWSAVDPRIGRRVAVKFLRIPDGLSPAHRQEWEGRFLLEARAAGRLSHPGIVSIHDVGTASDGRPYIVMELVEGTSLDAIPQADRPPLSRIIEWTVQVAEALDVAHRAGVIHRDVKPANILVGVDGRARIADFGIARVAESELTRDGTFVGSPAFAAPEQLCGAKVDGRADQFALATVFYVVATGRRPFEGEDIPSVVYAVCHQEPLPPSAHDPTLPAPIDAVVVRALAKSPDARFSTVREFAEALRGAAWGSGGPVDRAEARAGSIGSAAAVAMLRAARGIARTSRVVATAVVAWTRRTAPVASAGVADAARRAGTRRLAIAGAIAAISLAALLGIHALREERREERPFLDRVRAAVARTSSRVNVVVGHAPEAAVLEVHERGEMLLRRPLAPAAEGSPGGSFRLSPGPHELALSVTGPDGLELTKSLDVEVDPRAAYDLEISVATWPWDRLATDWDRVEE